MADPKVKIIVEADDSQAKRLEKTLRDLQKAADAIASAMGRATAASARQDAATTKAAISAQKLANESAKVSLAQQRVATEAERTAAAHARASAAQDRAVSSANRLSKAEQDVARATAQGEKELSQYERQLSRTATAQGDAAAKAATFKAQLDSFANTLRNVTFVAGVLGTVFVKAFDMAEEGAQITQTANAFENFATSIAGIPDLLDQLRAASNGTITDFDLMRNTLTLVAGTSQEAGTALAANAPKLLEIARAAQIMNPALGDSNFFFQSLATGIKRLEPRLVDNLGLVVKARDAYATYARQLGVSVQALTAEQKSQAFLNEVLRVGNLLIEQNGGAVQSAVDPYSQFRVEIQETGNALKQLMAEGLIPYLLLLNGEFKNGSAAVTELNKGTILSLEELTAAYKDAQSALGTALAVPGATLFVDVDQTIADIDRLEREIALAAGSYEEFARIVGQAPGRSVTGEAVNGNEDERRAAYERLIVGIEGATRATDSQKIGLAGYAPVQQQSIDLTEEQAEALEKLKEAWADAAVATIKDAGALTEFGSGLLAAADSADLVAGRVFKLAAAMGILSESELKAAQNAYEFQQIQARLMAEFARTGDIQAFNRQIIAAAQRLGIDYRTAAQKAAQATNTLVLAANLGAGSFVRFAQGLGEATTKATALARANQTVIASMRGIDAVSSGAASAFINALEGSSAGGGGGGGVSAIEAAAQAQQEWNAAFAQSFIQLLDAEEPIENWNTELLRSAAAAGASAETLALLAAATGEYSEEQIKSALHGAAMRQAIEEISAALVDGRATGEQALAAVAGFQEQLAQGGSFEFDLQAYGIEPLREQMAGAGGGAASAADETQNWTDNLLRLAGQGKLTAGDLVALATATGEYTDAQIQAALKTMFMQQKLEELAAQIGTRPIQDIIADLREFEGDLDKQFILQFSTGDAEEAIGRVHRGIDGLPDEKTITIRIKADPVPDLGNIPGVQNPQNVSNENATQHGGPIMNRTLVGEVRPEVIVGGQVIPRIPPGFLMAQESFAQTMAMAMSGSSSAPPSYSNTTNINRESTTNNNQKSTVINIMAGDTSNRPRLLELGAI